MGLQQRTIAGNTTYRWKCDIDGKKGPALSTQKAAERGYQQHMFNEHPDEVDDDESDESNA